MAVVEGGDWAGAGVVSSDDFGGTDAGGLGVDSDVATAGDGEAFGVKFGEGAV